MEKLLISILIFCSSITMIAQVEKCNYPERDKTIPLEQSMVTTEKPEKPVFSKFKRIKYDYRSAEPTPGELRKFLKEHPEVTTVIRLNGTGKDSNGFGTIQESKVCESLGVNFMYIPMTNDYKAWAESIMPIMLKENVLIHCHHGYDRTGFIFAYKMIKYHNFRMEQVRNMNGWNKYDKYSKKFYPVLNQLLNDTRNNR